MILMYLRGLNGKSLSYQSHNNIDKMDNWSKKVLKEIWDRISSLSTIIIFAIAAVAQLILFIFDPKGKIENR
jgi:hypothetical protein